MSKFQSSANRPDSFVIEVSGRQHGVVIQGRHGFKFYSASPETASFDGRNFASIDAVYLALQTQLQRRDRRPQNEGGKRNA